MNNIKQIVQGQSKMYDFENDPMLGEEPQEHDCTLSPEDGCVGCDGWFDAVDDATINHLKK